MSSKVAFGKSISTTSFTKLTTPLGRRSANASPLRSSNTSSRTLLKSNSKPDPFDSKASTIDKSHTPDTSPWQTIQKPTSGLISDSFLCGNLVSEDNSLDFSGFNLHPNKLDEMSILRKELHVKTLTIEHLKKENITLRKEIEEFISIADKIHKNLDQELRQYEAKIATLERENSDLLAENKFYKDQTHTRFKQKIISPSLESMNLKGLLSPFELEAAIENDPNKQDMEGFYSKINDKLMNFLAETKNQLESFHRNVKTEANEIKRQTPTLQDQDQIPSPCLALALKKTCSDARKGNQSPLPLPLKKNASTSRHVTPLTSRNITPTSSRNVTPKSALKSSIPSAKELTNRLSVERKPRNIGSSSVLKK